MALSIVDPKGGATGTPPPSVTAPNPCNVGDVILVMVQLFNSVTNSATVSDTVNSGNYTPVGFPLRDVTGGNWIQWFWTKCTASGTPVVSVTLTNSVIGTLRYFRVTGFTGTPTIDAAMVANYMQPASGTSVAISPPNTAYNNEAVFLGWKSTQNLSSTPSGWTSELSQAVYALIAATSGTSTAFNGTLAASAYYDAAVFGIYDATSVGPTVTAVNGGASIPEGATSIAVTGTGFASGMTAAIGQPGGVSVSQPFTYTSATAGTFDLSMEPSGSQLAFTDSTYATSFSVTVGGNSSSPFTVALVPPTGLLFLTLASVNPVSTNRITAIPDLAAADQLEASGNSAGTSAAPAGLVLVNDATFYFTSGNTPQNFWVRAYDAVNKVWGAWAEQVVSANATVPNIANLALDVGTGVLQTAGFLNWSVTNQYSLTVPNGFIIGTNPPAGTDESTAAVIEIFLSIGPAPITVPNLIGMTQSAAQSALQAVGLILGTVTQERDLNVPFGDVISQSPISGTVVSAGDSVAVVISVIALPINIEQTLISQFAQSPIICGLVDNMGTYFDQSTNWNSFISFLWDVDSAQGFGLDFWGKIVGVGRTLTIPNSELRFGFKDGAIPADVEPFGQGTFRSAYEGSGVQTYTLPDAGYRVLILAKALANISATTAPSMNQLLRNLFPGRGTVYVQDNLNMSMTVVFGFTLTAVESAIITQSGVFPRPAGVSMTITTP